MKDKNNSENINFRQEEFNNMNPEEKILKMAGGFIPPAGKPEKDVLGIILNKIESSSQTKTIRIIKILQAVAAIVFLALSVYSVNAFLINEREITKFAEQSEITLPDGTEVTLNAGSKLIWNNNKFTKNRLLTLNGEAYFDVKKGDKFIIKTNNGTIEILGTQLNVFSRKNNFRVSCISGKVKVSANNEQQIIIPGQMTELTASGLIKSNSETIINTTLWKDGLFHFEETPLVTIFDELERQFDISIKFKGGTNRLATVDFSNENLIEALDVVCIPMELSYEVQNNKKITILEKK